MNFIDNDEIEENAEKSSKQVCYKRRMKNNIQLNDLNIKTNLELIWHEYV